MWNSADSHAPWQKGTPRDDESDIRDAEAYEFVETETGPLLSSRSLGKQVAYEEGSTIDWLREEAAERERKRVMRSQRGLHGLVGMILDSAGMWLVIILTGAGTGVLGAWLDVLVKWYVVCALVFGGVPYVSLKTGWATCEKGDVRMASSTIRLHAVVGLTVSTLMLGYMLSHV